MGVEPAATTVEVGKQFDVTVVIQSGEQEVDIAGIFLTFDPALLQVTSVTEVGPLNTVLSDQFDNKAGTIEYQAGKLGPPFAKGTIPLVAIRFESSGGIADTSLVFSNNGPIQRTAVYRAGVNVLRQTIDGNVTIAAPTATPTNTPAATATATATRASQPTITPVATATVTSTIVASVTPTATATHGATPAPTATDGVGGGGVDQTFIFLPLVQQ